MRTFAKVCLLFGMMSLNAKAEVIIYEPGFTNIVRGIDQLNVGGTLLDVRFHHYSESFDVLFGTEIEPSPVPYFWNDFAGAKQATQAVADALINSPTIELAFVNPPDFRTSDSFLLTPYWWYTDFPSGTIAPGIYTNSTVVKINGGQISGFAGDVTTGETGFILRDANTYPWIHYATYELTAVPEASSFALLSCLGFAAFIRNNRLRRNIE